MEEPISIQDEQSFVLPVSLRYTQAQIKEIPSMKPGEVICMVNVSPKDLKKVSVRDLVLALLEAKVINSTFAMTYVPRSRLKLKREVSWESLC